MTARMVHIMWSVESRTMMKTCWCFHDVILSLFFSTCFCVHFFKIWGERLKSSMCFYLFPGMFLCVLLFFLYHFEPWNHETWNVFLTMCGFFDACEWLRSSFFVFPLGEGVNMFRKWKLLAPTNKTQRQKATGLLLSVLFFKQYPWFSCSQGLWDCFLQLLMISYENLW